jgi:NhaP-type Na+/H+ or K+/H+ antiporter
LSIVGECRPQRVQHAPSTCTLLLHLSVCVCVSLCLCISRESYQLSRSWGGRRARRERWGVKVFCTRGGARGVLAVYLSLAPAWMAPNRPPGEGGLSCVLHYVALMLRCAPMCVGVCMFQVGPRASGALAAGGT